MKNLLNLFICILFCSILLTQNCSYCKNNNEQFSEVINYTINTNIPIAKKNINKIFNEAKSEQNPYVRQIIVEQGVNEILFNFYLELIDKTDNYIKIKQSMPITDYHEDLKNFIMPYLKANHIKTSRLDSFLNYSYKKESYLKKKYGYNY